MFINFGDIPGHQNLFLDYLYEFENVKDFYANDFRNKDNYLKVFKNITEKNNDVHSRTAEIIIEKYKNLKPSEQTKKNLELLKQKDTLAIVTGQQLGILGGPLYTFHKIITAIKLSKQLSERYDEFNFVPVFWLEGDDHDFNEVRAIKLIDDSSSIVKIGYSEEIEEDSAKQSVGFINFDEGIDTFFSSLESHLRDTEFKDPLIKKLKEFYSPGKSFKESFTKLIYWIFDEYGLIIFDPQQKKLKEVLKPIFKKEITDFRQHTEELVHVSAKLEETYHAQVKVKPVNLFLTVDEGRYSIEPVENEFKLKRKRKSFSLEQMLEIVDKEPERFSPNVLMRPICQDYLLPTAFYIGGPSEISYFAQIKPLYSFYELQQPIIYPRSSATILESNIAKAIDKYDIDIVQIFLNQENVKKKVIDSISEITIEDLFNNASNEIEIVFDQLKERLFQLDKTISDSSKRYKDKIFQAINELKGKAEQAQQKKYEVTLRQIEKAAINIFPDKNLQEREINFIHFANKYGMDLIDKLYNELQINKFEHQIINI